MDWLANAFGFREQACWLNDDGVLEHGELVAGDGTRTRTLGARRAGLARRGRENRQRPAHVAGGAALVPSAEPHGAGSSARQVGP
jgi:hypothetical protein